MKTLIDILAPVTRRIPDIVVRVVMIPFMVIGAGVYWFIEKAESLRDWDGR